MNASPPTSAPAAPRDALGGVDRHLRARRAGQQAAGRERVLELARVDPGRAGRRSDRAAARRARAARRSRARRCAPTRAPPWQGTRGHAAYLAQWDGSSTCRTSRRLARRHRRPRICRSPRGCARARWSEFVGQTHLLGPSVRAADRDPVRRAALDDPLRPAGHRQDDAGADAGRVRRRRLRGALGGRGGARRGPRGDGARPRAPPRRPPHDLLPRRDPPLQQGPAGRAAARGRGGPGRARRRDDREPVLRGQLGADLAHAGL